MKQYLTFLLDKDGRSLIKQNNRVVSTINKVPLLHNPGGLDDIAIYWERTLNELGITRSLSTTFIHYFDGAAILREYLYNKTIEEKLYILLTKQVLKITDATYKWHGQFFYKGEIDTTTIKHNGVALSAQIAETGIIGKYKANKGTTVE